MYLLEVNKEFVISGLRETEYTLIQIQRPTA